MYSEWGEVLLPTSASGDAMLPVFASFRKKDSHIAVLALNKDPLAARTAHISLEDYDLDDVVEVMSLEQGVWMRQTSQQSAYEAGGSLEYTFPPYSVTLMLIKGHPRRDWWWSTIVYVLVAAVLLIYGWKHRRRNILMVEKSK
jgi:hypothetical protein